MKHTVVRYKVRPESRGENEDRIRAVFRALDEAGPEDLRYLVLANDAGEFVHVAASEPGGTALAGLPAFQAFQQGHAQRREGELSRSEFVLIGEYRPSVR
jgi:hypothetical protein